MIGVQYMAIVSNRRVLLVGQEILMSSLDHSWITIEGLLEAFLEGRNPVIDVRNLI